MFIKDHFPSVVCKDGTRLSVQASEMHYATPRNNSGPYTQVEVGFPTVNPPETWAEYADGSFPSDVYAYIPLTLVQQFIDEHGGVDIAATINRWSEKPRPMFGTRG